LQNGYFGGYLTKQIIITFRDATNQADLIYGYTLSQRIFTFADSEHSVRYIRPIRPAALINDFTVHALVIGQITREASRPFPT
jgi:hypothetical protein